VILYVAHPLKIDKTLYIKINKLIKTTENNFESVFYLKRFTSKEDSIQE
jgi:hypothetical protein